MLGYSAHKLGFDAAHSGVCEAFQAIQRQGYSTIYVSARPITKAAKTRELLALVGQRERGIAMPRGPLITTSERSMEALVRSLRRRCVCLSPEFVPSPNLLYCLPNFPALQQL